MTSVMAPRSPRGTRTPRPGSTRPSAGSAPGSRAAPSPRSSWRDRSAGADRCLRRCARSITRWSCWTTCPPGMTRGAPARLSNAQSCVALCDGGGHRPAPSGRSGLADRRTPRGAVARPSLGAAPHGDPGVVAAAAWRYWRDRNIGQQTGIVRLGFAAGRRHDPDRRDRAGQGPRVAGRDARPARGSGEVRARHRARLTVDVGRPAFRRRRASDARDRPRHIDISQPLRSGAQVILDGVGAGRSPLSLQEVPPGEHALGSNTARLEFERTVHARARRSG